MVQTLYASKLSLYEVEKRFDLQFTQDETFFSEWCDDLPEISDRDRQRLDEVKNYYFYLSKYPMLEVAVKMVVLSPLLELAGFYESPFLVRAEESVEIEEEEEGEIIKGQIDILVVQNKFWIAVIEAKLAKFNVMEALPQILTYMMAAPHPEKPVFGMITSGDHTLFVKVRRGENPQYALSDSFFLFNRGNALYGVLRILKRFGQQALVSA
jgi:hypothetical protein